jgi:predicted Fe-Mo cluster-binding NifX family protein
MPLNVTTRENVEEPWPARGPPAEKTVKIAIATDDGRTISRHFGRATQYAVLTVEGGAVMARELRPKFSPHASAAGNEEHGRGDHGTDPASVAKHDQMAATVSDCTVVLCRGMGQGAYQGMTAHGIRPIVTEIEEIERAAIECEAGLIVDHPELLH